MKIVFPLFALLVIALAALYRFDKFDFLASNGKAKVEIRGELQENKAVSGQPVATASASLSTATASAETNRTEGAQSPIQHNLNSTSVIKYDAR